MLSEPDRIGPADWRSSSAVAASARLAEAAAWWFGLAGDGAAPAEAAKRTLPAGLRPTVVLLDVLPEASDVRMTLVGERIRRHTGDHAPGKLGSQVYGPLARSRIMADMHKAATTARPVAGMPGYVGPDAEIGGAVHLVLPLTDAAGTVVQLLAVVDFMAAPQVFDAPAPQPRLSRLGHPAGLAGALFAVVLLCGGYLYHLLQGVEEDRLQRQAIHLEDTLRTTFGGLERTIQQIAARIEAGKVDSGAEFSRLVDTLLADHPGRSAIRAAVLAPRLPRDALDGFDELVRRHVDPALTVEAWPDSAARQGYPALLVWPDPRAPQILGYDLWTDQARRAAMRRAQRLGQASASAPVVLTQDAADGTPAPVSSLLLQRVRGPIALRGADGHRLRVPAAAVAMGITLDEAVLQGVGGVAGDLHILISDLGPAESATAPGTAAANTGSDPESVAILALPADLDHPRMASAGRASRLSFAGREIGLWVEPHAFVDRNLAEMVAGGLVGLGALLSIAVGMYLQRATAGQSLLERQVAERTREIAELNRELTTKANQAIMADTAKSRLLATLSHELRTPLNGIIGFTDLLKLRFDSLTPEQHRGYLDTVAEAGQHMQRVVTRFLELSQDTPRAESLKLERVDLHELEGWLCAMLTTTAERYGVALRIELTGASVSAVRADAVALRQALLNFVDNALKFTASGGRVEVTVAEDAQGLVVAVRDTGVGMPPARLAALEEPLTEGGAQPVNGQTGLGLGLTLSRSLLALMGFSQRLTSQVGRGTTVEVGIPNDALYRAAPRAEARIA
jgi:signal transduction histidine kinase